MASLAVPPAHGSRQLHQTLDYLATTSPDRLYAAIPRSSDVDDGFRDISFRDMARCSDVAAHWIHGHFGRSLTFQTLCFIGIPDLGSVAIFFGAVKCGYKVFFPSPRNPVATNASLLEQTQCTAVIHAAEVAPIVKQLGEAKPGLQCLSSPSFQDMLQGHHNPFPYEQCSFEAAKNNPIVVLHSSGSTGIPKPIIMTHGTFSILDNERNLPRVPGRRNRDYSIWDFPGGGRFYHIFPYFHLAGFLSNVVNPTFTEASSPVLGPPLQPPSAKLLKDLMKSQPLRALYIPPAIAEQLLQEHDSIDLFQRLDFLCYTGAPFSPSAGQKLVEVTELVSLYGSTEAFQVPQLMPSKQDWAYMEWNPNFKLEMQPSSDEEGAYELVLLTDSETERISALNHNLPGVREWRTKDLFKPHPSKPNLWRYFGRRDDIIVLSNSEKFNPVPLELALQGHPLLAGALVVGQGRVRATLLVEPKATVGGEERASLVDAVWPRVQEANNLVPGHGRISRSNIIVAEKPFTRAGKGTVVRKLTEQTFESEIASLYTADKLARQRIVPRLTATLEQQAVLDLVRSALVSSFPAAASIADDDDLFSHGLDSLQTAELVATLKAGIGAHAAFRSLAWITPTAVYHHPTIQQLATVVFDFLDNKSVPRHREAKDRFSLMDEVRRQYTTDIPQRFHLDSPRPSSGITAALTGSTGSLGTSILASLLRETNVKLIFCLNRDPNAENRQRRSLRDQGVVEFDSSRLHFMTVHLARPSLGLSPEDSALLLENADVMIHNAWRVDFNLSLQSFASPHLQSVQTMVDMSAASKKNARIYFISSVSSMMGSGSVVPECVAQDFSKPMALGYAESKCVAEMILARASSVSAAPVTILRVGQVAGSTDPEAPVWPTQEWLYPVIKASRGLGLIPVSHIPINWVPIDWASSAITELVLSRPKESLEVYNIVNPRPVSWNLLADELQGRFGPDAKTATLGEWAEEARKHTDYMANDPMLEPALKLVDQMMRVPSSIEFDTEKAAAASHTMASMRPIDRKLLGLWLDKWNL